MCVGGGSHRVNDAVRTTAGEAAERGHRRRRGKKRERGGGGGFIHWTIHNPNDAFDMLHGIIRG